LDSPSDFLPEAIAFMDEQQGMLVEGRSEEVHELDIRVRGPRPTVQGLGLRSHGLHISIPGAHIRVGDAYEARSARCSPPRAPGNHAQGFTFVVLAVDFLATAMGSDAPARPLRVDRLTHLIGLFDNPGTASMKRPAGLTQRSTTKTKSD
jgi:hypothetical protein